MFLKDGRDGRAQRGQHLARLDLLQPLSANDGGRRIDARRGDRPVRLAGAGAVRRREGRLRLRRRVVPGIRWDAKYATWDNFTGTPVDGYEVNRIVGTMALCAALAEAQDAGRGPRLRPAALGRLPPATRRRLLPALVAAAGGRPDEAAALPEHRPGRDVRTRLRGAPGRATAGAAPST